MATPNIDSLFPLLLPELPECPLDTVRLAVRRAGREFCRQSTAWRLLLDPIAVTLDPVALDRGLSEYLMPVPEHTQVVIVCNVYAPVGELIGKSLDQLAFVLPEFRSAVGYPRFFNSLDYKNVRLYPTPVEQCVGQAYVVRAALMPTLAMPDLPEELATRYEEALAAGTLARLLAIPDRPWSKPGEAAKQQMDFDKAAVKARMAMEHERVRGNITVKSREFGR